MQCSCGLESDDPYSEITTTCSDPCSGDPTQTCGDSWAITVYIATDCLGCFVDSASDRVLTGESFKNIADLTPAVRERVRYE